MIRNVYGHKEKCREGHAKKCRSNKAFLHQTSNQNSLPFRVVTHAKKYIYKYNSISAHVSLAVNI